MKRLLLGLTLAYWIASSAAFAAGFEIALSPGRFELTTQSGQRMTQSITLQNLGGSETEVSLRSLDWAMSDDGNVTYFDELQPGSCRPWLTLERRGLKIPPRSKRSFRFQLDIPADAKQGECRLMIAVEGVGPATKTLLNAGGAASLNMPVSGRIAVPVYLAVNGARPKLELLQTQSREIDGKRVPMVEVKNSGDAHGRLEGSLEAKDADNVSFLLEPFGGPIMPGQTRWLQLAPYPETRGGKLPAIRPPFKTQGVLEWEGGAFKIETVFE